MLCTEVEVTEGENGITNIPGVFAAGNVVTGPKTAAEVVVHTKRWLKIWDGIAL